MKTVYLTKYLLLLKVKSSRPHKKSKRMTHKHATIEEVARDHLNEVHLFTRRRARGTRCVNINRVPTQYPRQQLGRFRRRANGRWRRRTVWRIWGSEWSHSIQLIGIIIFSSPDAIFEPRFGGKTVLAG